MTNAHILGVYIPLLIVTLGVTAWIVAAHGTRYLTRPYLFCALMTMGWQLTEIFYLSARNADLAMFLFDLYLPFVAFTSLGVFIFFMRFYGMETTVNRTAIYVLAVVPFFTLALTLIPQSQTFLRTGLYIFATLPHTIFVAPRGPWFWVHTGYCYVLLGASFFLALMRHRKLLRAYRRTSAVLVIGMLISVSLNVLLLVGVFPPGGLDPSLIGLTLCVLFMAYCVRENHGLEPLNRARRDVWNALDVGMFVLDDRRRITTSNRAGGDFIAATGLSRLTDRFDLLLEAAHNTAQRAVPSLDEEGGLDFYFPTITYNVRERPILDNRQRPIGAFVDIQDVTLNRQLIQRLEDEAEVDAMTGLYSRLKMNALMQTLDTPENYPLAVMIGDVNNLKVVNDTYGHQQGDVMLRLIAELLQDTCPPQSHIGRVGGDEFLVLLPRCTAEQAQELVQAITQRLARLKGYLCELTMPLGVAAKVDAEQDMQDVFRLADTRMYVRKNLYKTQQENRRTTLGDSSAGATS